LGIFFAKFGAVSALLCSSYWPPSQSGRNSLAFDELAFHHSLARPGTIIEVGANVGSMTLHFAVWERQKLVAFEPFPPVFESLKQQLTKGFNGNIPDRVRLFQAAVGDKPGTARMRVPKTERGIIDQWASLAKTFEHMEGVGYDELWVPVLTIDSLDISDVTNIKIDVEGYEIEVLHGARRTLQKCRPVVSVECEERHRKGTTWYVPGFMRGLDYNWFWYDHRKNEFWPISKFDREEMQVASRSPIEEAYGDPYIFIFFYIPREDYESHLRLAHFGPVHYE
jgi:FkbM family methyltransferase